MSLELADVAPFPMRRAGRRFVDRLLSCYVQVMSKAPSPSSKVPLRLRTLAQDTHVKAIEGAVVLLEDAARAIEDAAPAIEAAVRTGAVTPASGRTRWENALRALASRGVGNTIAVVGIGLTGVAVWYYWPAATAQTIKPSLLDALFVGEKIPSRFAGKWPLLALLAGWAIIPSGWFLLEWAYGSPHADSVPESEAALRVRQQQVEEFKYMQSLSRAIWVAVLAVLAVLFGVSITGPGTT
jgi:hypothetical protein